MRYDGKKVLVAGSGISGIGAKEALASLGAQVYTYLDGQDFMDDEYDLIVLSPSFRKSHFLYQYAKLKGIRIIGEYALGSELNTKPLISVTGTNGKTTVVKMLYDILSKQYKVSTCGNIGVSFARCAVFDDYEIALTEASSFQLQQTPFIKPKVAVITNVTPDHLNYHKNMEEYTLAKYSISAFQDENDFLVLPYDEKLYKIESLSTNAKKLWISVKHKVDGAYLQDEWVYFQGEKLFHKSALKLKGEHNLSNMLFAVAVSRLFGVSSENIEQGVLNFVPERHRIEFVTCIDGVKFYNDSKSTNEDSTIKAVRCMEGSVCLILCGNDKGLSYDRIFSECENLKRVNVTGNIAHSVLASANRAGFSKVRYFQDLESATVNAFMSRADNVLLSPASASFDRFSSYEERGKTFIKIVSEIADGK